MASLGGPSDNGGGAYQPLTSSAVPPPAHNNNATTTTNNNNGADDVAGLWDELSHQQSREIQQYEERMAAAAAASRGMRAPSFLRQTLSASLKRPPTTLASETTRRAPLADFGFAASAAGAASPMGEPLLEDAFADNAAAPPAPQPQQQPPPQEKDFVFLRELPSMPRGDGWGAVPNLDLFFASIYNYYYHKGLTPIIGKGLVELVSLFFTLWLSVFLFVYLDWAKLATCKDEDTCHARLADYILDKPFEKSSLWHFMVVSYCIIVSLYGLFSIFSFLATLRDALEAKSFFENCLGISALRLEGGAVEWDEIVTSVQKLQQSGEYRIAIHGQGMAVDALVVAQRILRRENFLVAFFNRNLLNLTVPIIPGLKRTRLFSKSLEWSLYFCILSYMFNDKYQIRPAFYLNPSALRRRFVLCGVAHAVFMPFLLFFMTLHFFMLNIYDWRSSKQYLGPRDWSLLSKWTMREFNELPHAFEHRLGPSYEAAEKYMKLFTQSATVAWTGRLIVFLSGSLGAVLLALGAVNDSILLHIKIGPWNLLWFVVVLGVVYSGGKGMLPEKGSGGGGGAMKSKNLFAEMDAALAAVASHTHHYPEYWKGRAWDKATQKAFASMIGFKAQLFGMEALSTLLAPLVLCVSLPPCCEDLCAFCHLIRLDVPGAGEVCGYSTFDFERFSDEDWQQASTTMTTTTTTNTTSMLPKTRQGKMEKSLFSFKAAHPHWTCDSSPSGRLVIRQLEVFRQEQEAAAMALERQMQLQAAVLALQRLEQTPTTTTPTTTTPTTPRSAALFLQDYVARPGGADSGGGGPAEGPGASPVAVTAAAATATTTAPTTTTATTAPTPPRMATSLRPEGPLEPISESSASLALLPAESLMGPDLAATSLAGSVPHYADTGILSTELRQLLNRSTLDPSLAGSLLLGRTLLEHSLPPVPGATSSFFAGEEGPVDSSGSLRWTPNPAQREYLWLERFHSQHDAAAAAAAPTNENSAPS